MATGASAVAGWIGSLSASTIAAGVGAAAAVAGTYMSMQRAEEAQAARKKAREKAEAMNKAKSNRRRRKMIAQRRQQIGSIRNAAAVSGTTGSSGALGAQASLRSDYAGDVGFNTAMTQLNSDRLDFISGAQSAASDARAYQTIAGLGTQMIGWADQFSTPTLYNDAGAAAGRGAGAVGQATPLGQPPTMSVQRIR